MKRKELEKLYLTMKTKDVALMLNVSIPTLMKMLKNNKIKKKGKKIRITKSKLIIK